MNTDLNRISSNYRTQKSSTVIIAFIGLAFIFLAVINFSFEVPEEYLIGVSFAAFFFIIADLAIMSATVKKPLNENLYYTLLFFAVMSFILIPIALPLFPLLYSLMASSSESLSIASLGIVLIMMNLKLLNAEEEFFERILSLSETNATAFEEYEKKVNSSMDEMKEMIEDSKDATKLARETTDLSKEILEVNKNLWKLIEEGETLEEVREKATSYFKQHSQ